jgi:hypothetical protein
MKQSWLISNLMHKIFIYIYIIHLLKSSTFFEHYPAHLQEVYFVIVYMQPLVSSLCAGDCLVHRTTFNYHSPKIRKMTNLFKNTNIGTAFKTTTTLHQFIKPKKGVLS